MARRHNVHDIITSRKAAKPLGPTVQGIRVKSPGQMLFVSGQLPIEIPSGRVFNGDIKRQAELVFTHVRSIVTDAKFSMDEIVRVTMYVTDLANLEKIDVVYQKQFVGASLPTRSVLQVAALPKDVGLQIEVTAIKTGGAADDIFADADFA